MIHELFNGRRMKSDLQTSIMSQNGYVASVKLQPLAPQGSCPATSCPPVHKSSLRLRSIYFKHHWRNSEMHPRQRGEPLYPNAVKRRCRQDAKNLKQPST